MARLRLQQVEEAFRLEKEKMEAKERKEALERAEQQRHEEEQCWREEEQREEQRQREEGQREEQRRREEEQREEQRRREEEQHEEQRRREEEQREEQRWREEEQREEQRRRDEEQRKEERRRKVNEMARKRDLELLRLRQEQQAVEYEEQLWENTSRGKTASLRKTVVKSSGNVNVPVNTLPETVVADQFKGDASGRPESRPTTVNPLPLQRQQQQIGELHESSTDASGVKETSSFSHLQRGLSPWAVKHDQGQDRERLQIAVSGTVAQRSLFSTFVVSARTFDAKCNRFSS